MQTTSPREGKLNGRTTPGAVGVRQTFCLIFHLDVVFVSEIEPEIRGFDSEMSLVFPSTAAWN